MGAILPHELRLPDLNDVLRERPEWLFAVIGLAEAATFLNVGEQTLFRWKQTGRGPAWVATGPKRYGFRRLDLIEWTLQHRHAAPRSGADE